MQWAYSNLNDHSKFPLDDEELSLAIWSTKSFAQDVGDIFKRLFRVYAIIYSTFFKTYEELQLAAELNSCFKHFVYFCLEYGLLQAKETQPLDVLVKPIKDQFLKSKAATNAKKKKSAAIAAGK
jgi:MOB kinase activator 1